MHLVKKRGGVHFGRIKRGGHHARRGQERGGHLAQVNTYARTGQERWAPWVRTESGKVGKRWAPCMISER